MENKYKAQSFLEFGLTPEQKKFVDEYLVDLKHTNAVRRINPGMSNRAVSVKARRMMNIPAVKEAIAHHMKKREVKREIKAEMVVEELARIAFQDVRNVVSFSEAGVVFKNSAELDDDTARSICEVSETTTQHGGTKRIKMYDKVNALELLGRHLGMWKEKVEHSGGIIVLDGSRKRDPDA